MSPGSLGALALAMLLAAPASAHEGHAPPPVPPAPGPRFEAPAPGSYALPPIARVQEHALLGPDGERVPLLGLAPAEVAFVSFVYLHCADACPAATAMLQRLDQALAERPALARRVRLVTVSFDPARDTPEAMGALALRLGPRTRWRFLTAASPGEMRPVLEDFGQDAAVLPGAGPGGADVLRHVLKVFLVDAEGRVRNVYSTGFLDLRLLLNDALTLTGPEAAGSEASAPSR